MIYWRDLFGDFRNFLFYLWTQHLHLPAPTVRQYSIAEWLEHGPKRKIEEGYRGIGKSWITSAFVAYRLGKYYLRAHELGASKGELADPQVYRLLGPEPKFLVVSASKRRADDFSIFTLQLLAMVPELSFLVPTKDQRQSKIAFDVAPAGPSHAPTVKSVGITGQLTGSRASDIIADDVEVPNNSSTQELREALLKRCMEFEAILMPEEGDFIPTISYLGTPQTEESIYNKLRERGYACRIHPALYPTAKQIEGYRGALDPAIEAELEADPSLVGKPTDPLRFSASDLEERRLAYGNSGFNLQFMLDTTLSDSDRYPLKTSDIIVLEVNEDKAPVTIQYAAGPDQLVKDLGCPGFAGDRWYRPLYVSPEWTNYEGVAMGIDPAGRGKDELAYAIGSLLHGRIHVPEVEGLRGGYTPENLAKIAQSAKRWKVNQIIIESNFGDGMFAELLKPILQKIYPCAIEEVRASTQKERRIIDTLEPVMNQHRLIIDPAVIKKDLEVLKDNVANSLFYQMTRITKDRGSLKHDDRLDALAIVVAWWVQSMARDAATAEEDWRQQKLEEELRQFMDGIILDKPQVPPQGFSASICYHAQFLHRNPYKMPVRNGGRKT